MRRGRLRPSIQFSSPAAAVAWIRPVVTISVIGLIIAVAALLPVRVWGGRRIRRVPGAAFRR